MAGSRQTLRTVLLVAGLLLAVAVRLVWAEPECNYACKGIYGAHLFATTYEHLTKCKWDWYVTTAFNTGGSGLSPNSYRPAACDLNCTGIPYWAEIGHVLTCNSTTQWPASPIMDCYTTCGNGY